MTNDDLDAAIQKASADFRKSPERPTDVFRLGRSTAERGDVEGGLELMLSAQLGAPVPQEILTACTYLPRVGIDALPDLCGLLVDAVWDLRDLSRDVPLRFYALLFSVIHFKRRLDFRRLETIYERFVLPLMTRALDARRIDLAYPMMVIGYNEYLKAKEEEDHFARVVAGWERIWSAAAREYGGVAKSVAPTQLPRLEAATPYRLTFLLPTGSRLAHTEALIAFLRAYRTLDPKPFLPSIVVFEGEVGSWKSEIEGDGITVISVDQLTKSKDLRERADALKLWLVRESVVVVVMVSIVHLMPFLFTMPLAPVQIWWALKYHAFSHDKISGYVTSAPSLRKTVTINGRPWRNAKMGFHGLYDAGLQVQARQIRSEIPSAAVVFATLAREEKLKAPEFLNAVATILQRAPTAYFLWTGIARDPMIEAHFFAAGVAARVKFIGWVDTRLYAQVLDVFLDSFPFGCGLTLCQAMAAGKPAVMFDKPGARMHHWPAMATAAFEATGDLNPDESRIREIFEFDPVRGSRLFFHAKTQANYVSAALALAEDQVLRGRAGAAARTYALEFFADSDRMAQSLAGHFHDVVVTAVGEARGSADTTR